MKGLEAVLDGLSSIAVPPPPKAKPAPRAGRSKAVRRECLARDGKCVRCHSRKSLECHHVQAIQDGGPDTLDNVVTLCFACHAEWTHVAEPLGVQWGLFMRLPSVSAMYASVSVWCIAHQPDTWQRSMEHLGSIQQMQRTVHDMVAAE